MNSYSHGQLRVSGIVNIQILHSSELFFFQSPHGIKNNVYILYEYQNGYISSINLLKTCLTYKIFKKHFLINTETLTDGRVRKSERIESVSANNYLSFASSETCRPNQHKITSHCSSTSCRQTDVLLSS